jgi:trehalose 6-phosphate phosphatase
MFAWSNVLLAFDYDGTLAPLVAAPHRARMRVSTRRLSGKLVVNLLVPDAPHKGLALERERAHFACDTVVYVGDDETDEDVFQLDRPGRLLSIRVGQKRSSAASYYIRNRAEIDRLLETLIALRGDRR